MRPEDRIADKKRPFNGTEYLDSLKDGREVYIYGERVEDVTTHPAFRNSARRFGSVEKSAPDSGPLPTTLPGPARTGLPA